MCGVYLFKDSFYFYSHPNNQIDITTSMINGDGHCLGRTPTAERPGYVTFLFLSRFLIGDSPTGILIGQSLLGAIITLLIWLLCKIMNNNDKTAFLASIFYAGNPIAIRNDLRIQEYAFFSLTILCLLYLFVLYKNNNQLLTAFLLGLLISISLLSRPLGFILIVIIFIHCLIRKYRYFVIVLLTTLVLPLMWGFRNQNAMGKFVTINSPNGIEAFYQNNNEKYANFNELFHNHKKDLPEYKAVLLSNRDEHPEAITIDYCSKEGLNFVMNNPIRFTLLSLARFILLLSPVRMPRASEYEIWTENQLLKDLIYTLFFAPFLILSIICAVKYCRTVNWILISVFSVYIIQSLVQTGSQYTLQAYPLMAILSAIVLSAKQKFSSH
ncbi:MAG: glycosyltransferase family 39 protein [Planctomycetes bacterium]|nr:glycosyltransferase family 39 protein [Planctomycetota bacterium]